MQTRPRERARGALVVDDDPQRRPRLLGNATGMGDVARIDRERPGEVAEPGARDHLGLDQRRHGEPTRTLLELETTELHTLVCLGVRPECDAELPSPRGHVREIALDDIQVEQEGRGFDLVDVHVSPSLFPFPVISRRGDRKSTRLNSSHTVISYAVFCLKKKTEYNTKISREIRGRGVNSAP